MTQYKLWISPTDYFGTHGKNVECISLQEAIDEIEKYENDPMYIRLQKYRTKGGYWRVLFKPVDKEGMRQIQATNDWQLTDRIFHPKQVTN
jgi:hypothetical protein